MDTLYVNEDTTTDNFMSIVRMIIDADIPPAPGTYTPFSAKNTGSEACDDAATMGRNDLLHVAYSSGLVNKSERTMARAAGGGHLETVKYLKYIGCPWDEKTPVEAAHSGNMEVLQWVINNGCPCNGETMLVAASRGDLDMVIWLHSNGHPIYIDAIKSAVYAGAIEIIGWARSVDIGCRTVFSCAVDHGDIDVLNFLRVTRYPYDSVNVDSYVRMLDVDPDVVEWLRVYGYVRNS